MIDLLPEKSKSISAHHLSDFFFILNIQFPFNQIAFSVYN